MLEMFLPFWLPWRWFHNHWEQQRFSKHVPLSHKNFWILSWDLPFHRVTVELTSPEYSWSPHTIIMIQCFQVWASCVLCPVISVTILKGRIIIPSFPLYCGNTSSTGFRNGMVVISVMLQIFWLSPFLGTWKDCPSWQHGTWMGCMMKTMGNELGCEQKRQVCLPGLARLLWGLFPSTKVTTMSQTEAAPPAFISEGGHGPELALACSVHTVCRKPLRFGGHVSP